MNYIYMYCVDRINDVFSLSHFSSPRQVARGVEIAASVCCSRVLRWETPTPSLSKTMPQQCSHEKEALPLTPPATRQSGPRYVKIHEPTMYCANCVFSMTDGGVAEYVLSYAEPTVYY
jgi:hypothetical protein